MDDDVAGLPAAGEGAIRAAIEGAAEMEFADQDGPGGGGPPLEDTPPRGKGARAGKKGGRPRRRGADDALTEAVAEVNRTHALVLHGTTALVMREQIGESGRRELVFQKPADFKLWFSNRRFRWEGEDKGLGDIWLQHPDRRAYEGIVFVPTSWERVQGDVMEARCPVPPGYHNLWQGYAVEPAAFLGDVEEHRKRFARFADHLEQNIANGDAHNALWLWAWAAHLIQRPTERLGVTPVLQGRMGTGKSVFGKLLGRLLGPHYLTVAHSRHLVGNFNAHMANCLLLQAEEAFWAGDANASGVLKDLVTNDKHMIEGKHRDPVEIRNFVHLLMTSNESFVVPAGFEERRWAVFSVGSARMQDAGFFGAMEREMEDGGLAHLLAYLINFDLGQVDLRRIPNTQALWEQKVAAMTPEQAWWLSKLRDGKLLAHDDGWEQQVITRYVYGDYVKYATDLGVRRKKTEEQLAQELGKLLPVTYPRRSRPWKNVHDRTGALTRQRERCYELPTLKECREHFCELVSWPVDWGREGDDGGPAEAMAA